MQTQFVLQIMLLNLAIILWQLKLRKISFIVLVHVMWSISINRKWKILKSWIEEGNRSKLGSKDDRVMAIKKYVQDLLYKIDNIDNRAILHKTFFFLITAIWLYLMKFSQFMWKFMSEIWAGLKILILKKWSSPAPFSLIFGLFQTNFNTIFVTS